MASAAILKGTANFKRMCYKNKRQITVADIPIPHKRKALADLDTNKLKNSVFGPSKDGKLPIPRGRKVGRSKSIETLCGVLRQVSIEDGDVPPGVVNIDQDYSDPANYNAYAKDVTAYMRKIEANEELQAKRENFKKFQTFSFEARAILIDWLLQVQYTLDLQQETIYKTVLLLDRFLCVQHVSIRKLQLVGMTCLFIASKFVEQQPPNVADLRHLSDNAYSYEDIIKTEWFVLKLVKFDLKMADPTFFLTRLLVASNVDITNRHLRVLVKHLSFYFIDQMMPYSETMNYKPSRLSAAGLCLARYIIMSRGKPSVDVQQPWNETLQHYSTYKLANLQHIIKRMAKRRIDGLTGKLQGVHIKYSSRSRYNNLSNSLLMREAAFCYIALHGIPVR